MAAAHRDSLALPNQAVPGEATAPPVRQRCAACRDLTTSPGYPAAMTSPPRYDGLADWYDREIGGLEVTTTALEVLGRLVGAGPGTCLDLGCGTGIAIPSLLERGWRVVGVDLSGDQLRIARQRAGPPGAVLVAADATALPFADCSFDAVVSVLTHTDFDDPEAAFAEAARVLRTGGRLSYRVGVHHLPLADLIGLALATGLTLTRLEEPGEDDYPFLIALQLQR